MILSWNFRKLHFGGQNYTNVFSKTEFKENVFILRQSSCKLLSRFFQLSANIFVTIFCYKTQNKTCLPLTYTTDLKCYCITVQFYQILHFNWRNKKLIQ